MCNNRSELARGIQKEKNPVMNLKHNRVLFSGAPLAKNEDSIRRPGHGEEGRQCNPAKSTR